MEDNLFESITTVRVPFAPELQRHKGAGYQTTKLRCTKLTFRVWMRLRLFGESNTSNLSIKARRVSELSRISQRYMSVVIYEGPSFCLTVTVLS